MDFRTLLRPLLTTAAALALFFTVSALYFAPQFGGETLPQHDVLQYEGMSHEIKQMRAEHGEDPQWAGNMFGGMPAFLINVAYPAQLVKNTVAPLTRIVDTPAAFLFFAMTAMWCMLLICGVDPRAAVVGALAYGLSTYFLLIIGAGHITKMWALVYAPLMMGGAWMTLRGAVWPGAALTALAASLEIGANHPQITYYFVLAMGLFWLSEGIAALRERRTGDFARRTALLAAAGLVALASNFAPLWYTAQHTGDTIRGGSELAEAGAGEGLDLDYATAWSYGRAETLNLLVPDFMGRDSGETFPADGAVASTVGSYGLRGAERQLPAYWGDQPYTAGPTYLGAAALLLAVVGLFLLKGRDRWWLLAACLLMILLSWGRNLMGFTELAFRLLPGYDKFRTVSMTLVVVQWAVPLLGALGLAQLLRGVDASRLRRALAWGTGLTGGLCLLLLVAGGALFDFGEARDAQAMSEQFRHLFAANDMQSYIDRGMDVEWGETVGAAMAADRAAMMRADAARSLAMILLAAGALWFFARGRIGRNLLVGWLALVMLVDLVPVDRRFLSEEQFVPARSQQIRPSAADKAILADPEPGFRVLNLTVSPFNDATTSYFHRSVGGYHGAKLARYQDLIDRYLSTADDRILDLLNTRYLIVPGSDGAPEARLRGTELGAAWFVDRAVGAATPREEIDLLGEVDLRTTAVVAESDLAAATGDTETTAPGTPAVEELPAPTIRLAEYRSNYLRYTYYAPRGGTAVFSEIFYDKGWTAYVDGVETPAFRADYLLRAMRLPAGQGTVEWRFRAPGWRWVESITGIASAVIWLGVAAAAVLLLRRALKRRQR